jgi:hypothetical protein
MRIGVAGWKYFTKDEYRDPMRVLEIPSYLAMALRKVIGSVGSIMNANNLLMDPGIGLRSTNSINQVASFEFAATICSQNIHNMIAGLHEGITEYDAVKLMSLNGMPLSCHVMLSTGERARLSGLCSPSMKIINRGDPLTVAVGLRGSLSCRAAYVVELEEELNRIQPGYLFKICIPYFGLLLKWYESIKIGERCGQIYEIIKSYLKSIKMELLLNPGHLIHLEEWLHSPFYEGSPYRLKSGMAIQVDMIPKLSSNEFGVNVEDTIVLADEELQDQLRSKYPETFNRIKKRQDFMINTLGIHLNPEVLPLSNDPAVLRPFLLSKEKALTNA